MVGMRSVTQHDEVPWWQVNVPIELQEEECPVYLSGLSDKDIGIIGTRDDQYKHMEWPEVKKIIGTQAMMVLIGLLTVSRSQSDRPLSTSTERTQKVPPIHV